MKRITSLLALAAALVLATPAAAQIEYGGRPYSDTHDVPAAPVVTMAGFDTAALLAEDAARGKEGAYRIAHGLDVDLNLRSGGQWTDVENGARVWRASIHSQGALGLAVEFSHFDLVPGAELFALAEGPRNARRIVLGAFTSLNNKPNGQFAIQPLSGDTLTLELYEPARVKGQSSFEVGTVYHVYRDDHAFLSQDPGQAEFSSRGDSCEIDINCPQGDGRERPARSVCRIFSAGSLCSGNLLNNTAEDGTQYFMTANHCGSMNNAIFYFEYQRSGCSSGGTITNQTVVGSTLMATNAPLDFRLVRIDTAIPVHFDPYLAGWRRDATASPSSYTIHHPAGCPKKISIDNQSPTFSGTFWQVRWNQGVTEGGSSGSPLFDLQGRMMGQLCCGSSSCAAPTDPDFYGRMSSQWSQISAFLDPLGTGDTRIDGLDPNLPVPNITLVSPGTVDVLIPGTSQTVLIGGNSFETDGSIRIGGVTPPGFTIGTTFATVDMPELTPGTHTIEIENDTGIGTSSINVIAPLDPKLQIGNGDTSNSVSQSGGIDVKIAGEPIELHFLYASFSNVPSVIPGAINLGLGNAFTEIVELGSFFIEADGLNEFSFTTSGLDGFTVYFQTLQIPLPFSFPLNESNLQSVFLTP